MSDFSRPALDRNNAFCPLAGLFDCGMWVVQFATDVFNALGHVSFAMANEIASIFCVINRILLLFLNMFCSPLIMFWLCFNDIFNNKKLMWMFYSWDSNWCYTHRLHIKAARAAKLLTALKAQKFD